MIGAVARGSARLAGVGLGLGTAATALPAAYLAVVTAAGLPRARPRSPAPTTHGTRFAVVVPAHDEAAGIGATLRSFDALCFPADRFQVHVVADNCTDRTAEVVHAHGHRVHERVVPDDPGKGPALNWLYDRLVDEGASFDAVVVVDADTTVDPDFLSAVDAELTRGAVAVQGRYSVRDADATPATSFRYAALACRHHLRPLGRTRLGASCGLYGNGMVFRREVLETHRWSGHLVEDAEFQMELLLEGEPVAYAPQAVVRAEMPTSLDGATTQNQRWERGRLDLAARYLPRLVRELPRAPWRRRVQLADAIADHLVPPLSVLVGAQAMLTVASAGAALVKVPGAGRLARTNAAGVAVVVAHVVAGLVSVGASRRHVLALSHAPVIVWWKIRLWSSVLLRGDQVTWSRTRRNDPEVTS